jgi:hypothetical protein
MCFDTFLEISKQKKKEKEENSNNNKKKTFYRIFVNENFYKVY